MRLERRLARERAARREAEVISERSTRRLVDEQERLLLLRTVGRAANEETLERALAHTLATICRHGSWALGHAWRLHPDGELRSTGEWVGAERFPAFREATEALTLRAGVGLPGRVVNHRGAIWLRDFSAVLTLPRAEAAAAAGLRTAIGFPIMSGSDVVGVIELFTPRILPRDAELLELLDQVGTELGRSIERQQSEERLRHQATHDALTGLPNRVMIRDALHRAISRLRREDDECTAVLFVDLDGFKAVNDTLGHVAGDAILKDVAARLRTSLRPHDTLGRLSGDEFVIVCESLASEHGITTITERITDAMRPPFEVEDELFSLTASIGVTVARPEREPEELIAEADTAMYRAKQSGRGHTEVYSEDLGSRLRRRNELERALRGAAAGDELRVHYQPEVDLRGGRIVGVEALVRWERHGAMVMPVEFIPLAEESGLIVGIGGWVLEEAARQAQRWRADPEIATPPWTSVNLSVRQLADPELLRRVADSLSAYGGHPSELLLEVTESVILEDVDAGLAVLAELRALGTSIAIDDFGTGYASLSYLRRFPASAVKIDRSFIAALDDPRTLAIVTAMVELAHALGLTPIAEGIETAQQLATLRELGCDLGQGYYFAQPLPADELAPLLRDPDQFAALVTGGVAPVAPPVAVHAPRRALARRR